MAPTQVLLQRHISVAVIRNIDRSLYATNVRHKSPGGPNRVPKYFCCGVAPKDFLWALDMGPFDSGGLCSMTPHTVHGIEWYMLGSKLGPTLGTRGKSPWSSRSSVRASAME